MTRKTLPSPSELKRRANAFAYVAQAIAAGLGGQPFAWGSGEWKAYSLKARHMGFTLLTKTFARRLGYRLREKAQPIGTAYFGSQRHGSVYVLECHFKPARSSEPAEPQTVAPETTLNAQEKLL